MVFVVLNGICAATAYQTHYRALELGPVAVVSPIGSAYAVIGVLLAVVFLGERPGVLALIGSLVTVAGVALVSTDLRELRAGLHSVARGVPWALVSTVSFGLAGFLLGYLSQHAGWVAGLWASRMAQVVCYIPLAFVARKQLAADPRPPGSYVRVHRRGRGHRRRHRLVRRVRARVRLDHARRQRGVPIGRRGSFAADPARAAGAEPVRGDRVGGRGTADAGFGTSPRWTTERPARRTRPGCRRGRGRSAHVRSPRPRGLRAPRRAR